MSRDSASSHAAFRESLKLPFSLLADTDEKLCKAFGVLVEKEVEGRTVMGVQRSTFLVDPQGVIRKVWPKVSVPNHARDVLAALEELS